MRLPFTLILLSLTVLFSKAQNTAWPGPTDNSNVGIGTASATRPLDVTKNGVNAVGNLTLVSRFTNSAGSKGISLGYNESAQAGIIYSENNTGVGSPLEFWTYNGSYFDSRIVFTQQGKLGIGASSPVSLFQVDDGCSKASIGDAGGGGLSYGTGYLGFNAARDGTSWAISSDSQRNGSGVIYGDIYGNINFSAIPTTSGYSKTITDNDVKNNLAFQITAAGDVRAKRVRVNPNGWADNVLKPSYNLASLSSVKAYIDRNHHLPDVPSEQEILKDGADLGEIVKLQMKKIEELTLYLIEKDKQIKQLTEV